MSDKKLFTPGPVGVSLSTKQAMLVDVGSRDSQFMQTVKYIRAGLLQIAGLSEADYTCVPVQGSGTFAIEAVFTSTVPRTNAKVLILDNGTYGQLMGQVLKVIGIDFTVVTFPEDERVAIPKVKEALYKSKAWTNVAMVHCETSTGLINPIGEIGRLVKEHVPDASFFVDAMSSFGAIDINMADSGIDFLVSTANKCLEGVPGFAFVLCRIDRLQRCQGWSRSLSLDLFTQWEKLERTGQLQFTPPTHTMLAFKQALIEFQEEGGISGRSKRHRENSRVLREGLTALGFRPFLDDTHDGYIITAFHFPQYPQFIYKDFYERLSEKDQIIYPHSKTKVNSFRISNIGHLFPNDMRHLVACIKEVCIDMGLPIPLMK